MKEVDRLIHGQPSRRDFIIGSVSILSSLALAACTDKKINAGPSGVTTATPSGQRTPRPEITPTPELSLAQKAMKEGKVAVRKEDWDNYFISISADEARRLLDKVNKEKQFTYLLPFDPRVENLIIETLDAQLTQPQAGTTRRFSRIGVANLSAGSTIYSPFDGKTRIGNIADIVNGRAVIREILPTVQNDTYQFTLYGGLDLGLRKEMTPSDPLKEEAIKIGDSLSVVGKDKITQEKFNIMYDINKGSEDFSLSSLTNLLTKEGKIAFIPQDKK